MEFFKTFLLLPLCRMIDVLYFESPLRETREGLEFIWGLILFVLAMALVVMLVAVVLGAIKNAWQKRAKRKKGSQEGIFEDSWQWLEIFEGCGMLAIPLLTAVAVAVSTRNRIKEARQKKRSRKSPP